jgi:hypothetical protein
MRVGEKANTDPSLQKMDFTLKKTGPRPRVYPRANKEFSRRFQRRSYKMLLVWPFSPQCERVCGFPAQVDQVF